MERAKVTHAPNESHQHLIGIRIAFSGAGELNSSQTRRCVDRPGQVRTSLMELNNRKTTGEKSSRNVVTVTLIMGVM